MSYNFDGIANILKRENIKVGNCNPNMKLAYRVMAYCTIVDIWLCVTFFFWMIRIPRVSRVFQSIHQTIRGAAVI